MFTSYRRPEIVWEESDEDDLSDHVRFRLWLARQLALMKAEGYQLKTRT